MILPISLFDRGLCAVLASAGQRSKIAQSERSAVPPIVLSAFSGFRGKSGTMGEFGNRGKVVPGMLGRALRR
jgi:hypothetical protein